MDAIVAYDLTKEYEGGRGALRRLNLQVPQGAAMACVGRENAGKTTLVRLLSGLCRPTSGECTVLGRAPALEQEGLHQVAGTVISAAGLYRHMTLQENLNFFAALHGVDSYDAVERSSFLLHKLDIWEEREEKIRELPTGVLRRAALARALMHRPQVLLMDLPPEGLDPESEAATKELLSHLRREEGMTLLLCTRNLAYAQAVCDSFALLREGTLLAKGTLESLRKGAGVRFQAALRLGAGEEGPQGFRYREEDNTWRREIDSEEEMPAVIAKLAAGGTALVEARVVRPTLEEIFTACLEGGSGKEGTGDEETGPEGTEELPGEEGA